MRKSFFMIVAIIICRSVSLANHYEISTLPTELKTQMIEMGTWKPDCPIEIDRLRLVKFIHYNFLGEQQQGKLIVLEAVAARVANIFETLYQYQFPIAQVKTIEEYNGSDILSMVFNNTSAFNYRPIAGKSLLSVHSYGVAIDINPIQNPCVESQIACCPEDVHVLVRPSSGQAYLNRTNIRLGMAEQNLNATTGLRVVELFKENGFQVWGGTWNDPVDWQHFQPSRGTAEWLAFMTPEDATLFFELYIANPTLLNNPKVRDFDFKTLYKKNRLKFMQRLHASDFWNMSPDDAYNSLLR